MAQPLQETYAPAITPEQLNQHATVDSPVSKRISRAQLVKRVAEQTGLTLLNFTSPPVMDLSARNPYRPAGFMDFYQPGRWDCASNLVFMRPIVQTGPSPGQWDGTVGYLRFKAPAAGTYLIVVNFSGFQTTMRLNGPWGTRTAFTAETSDVGVVTAPWNATAGQQVFFTISCLAPILGYFSSAQVFRQ